MAAREAYAYNLRRFTTTALSADEIHQIGLRMVDEIQKEMDAILRKLGRTEGSVRDRIRRLEQDLAYPLTDEGRTRIMADIDGMMRDAERRAAADFERQPKAAVVAVPFPRFREASAAAGYNVAGARRVAARHLPDSAAAGLHDEVRTADARLPRDRSRASLPNRARDGECGEPEVPPAAGVRRHSRAQRRLGAVRRALCRGVGVVRERSRGPAGAARRRALPGQAPRRGHRSAREASGRVSRPSTTASRPARSNGTWCTQARRAPTCSASSRSSSCARRPRQAMGSRFSLQGLPHGRAQHRLRAAARARAADRRVHRGALSTQEGTKKPASLLRALAIIWSKSVGPLCCPTPPRIRSSS